MSDVPLTVLIADDNADARASLRRVLEFAGLAVIGEAASTQGAISAAERLIPDAVVVDLDLDPIAAAGLDGLAATSAIAGRLPGTAIVVVAAGDEIDTIRRAMLAGARAYLTKPFVGDELVAIIRQASSRTAARRTGLERAARTFASTLAAQNSGDVVAFYSPSGGSGRTTLAVNLAIAAKESGKRVTLVDGSLQFGDVAAFLDLSPNALTIGDLADEESPSEADLVATAIQRHSSGVDVLLAPPRPSDNVIRADDLVAIIGELARRADLVVVDLGRRLDDATLAVLDMATRIIVPVTPEVASVRNAGRFVDLSAHLGYPAEKLVFVANRVGMPFGLRVADIQVALGRDFAFSVSDERRASNALNEGVPLIEARSRSPFAADIRRLAAAMLERRMPSVEPSVIQRAWLGTAAYAPHLDRLPAQAPGPADRPFSPLRRTLHPKTWPTFAQAGQGEAQSQALNPLE